MHNKIHQFITAQYLNIIKDIKNITLVPSPPFGEEKRVRFLKEYVEKLGYKNVKIDKEGNLVTTEHGQNNEIVIFSAHTDTVFPSETECKIKQEKDKIYCPGICDNSTGITALLYLMRLLKEIDIKPYCKTIFLFNVGEEGAGNLRGIRYFFDHLPKSQRAKIKAHICLEGHRIGRLTKKVVGSHRRKIRVLTKGGHSWRDFGAPNAIVKAAQIIDQLNQIKLPLEPKTTLNIGIISGGTSVNSIAEKTELSMEIRYLEQDILFEIIKKLDDVLSKVSGAKIEMEVIGNRPCGEMKDQKLIKLIKDIHKALGIKTIDDIGSTDSNYPISLGLPSITIGISEAENTHSLNEYLFLPPIRKGLEQVIMVFEKLNNSF